MTNRFDFEMHEDDELSALADGELAAGAASRICGQWRDDAKLRERWHEYHLIGDVLRSEDLVSTAGHDNAFVLALRSRMATEPIMIAPQDPIESLGASRVPAGRRRWAAVGAIAAGFVVVVAGALTIFGQPFTGNSSTGPVVATLGGSPAAVVVSSSSARVDPVGELQPVVASGQLIRDAKLDSYLSAHRQWSGGAMLGGHAAYLRNNAVDGSTR